MFVKLIDPWKYALDNDKSLSTLLIDLSKVYLIVYPMDYLLQR